MVEQTTDRRDLRVVRIIAVLVGAALMIIGLVSDWIGLCTVCGEFGKDQVLLILVGFMILLVGLLGPRITAFHRGMAILLLNTIILLILLEMGAILFNKIEGLIPISSLAPQPTEAEAAAGVYYASQDWAAEFWNEANSLNGFRYHPFVIWRSAPFEGKTINIDEAGIRRTLGVDCGSNSYKVFVFGGSTTWGYGSPDWGTIPTYLTKGLQETQDSPICVVNFGERAYNSTQGLITLMIQLQNDNVPDLVIFYDGVNEVWMGYFYGQPPVHWDLDRIAAKLEGEEESLHPLVRWATSFDSYSLFKRVVGRLDSEEPDPTSLIPTYQTKGIEFPILVNSTTQTYLKNYDIVDSMAHEYGFEAYFFWQPFIVFGRKNLTPGEQSMRDHLEKFSGGIELFEAVYRNVESAAAEKEKLYYIADVFDDQEQQIWIDDTHVTPEGNQLVAQRMLQIIRNRELLAGE